jgi:hypothetical protein
MYIFYTYTRIFPFFKRFLSGSFVFFLLLLLLKRGCCFCFFIIIIFYSLSKVFSISSCFFLWNRKEKTQFVSSHFRYNELYKSAVITSISIRISSSFVQRKKEKNSRRQCHRFDFRLNFTHQQQKKRKKRKRSRRLFLIYISHFLSVCCCCCCSSCFCYFFSSFLIPQMTMASEMVNQRYTCESETYFNLILWVTLMAWHISSYTTVLSAGSTLL